MTIGEIIGRVKLFLLDWLRKPERVYLSIAIVGVIGFVLITPPFQGPDEVAHYIRTQYIAHGYLLPVDVKKAGASLPISIQRVVDGTFPKEGIVGKTWEKYHLGLTKAALNLPLDPKHTYQPHMITYTALPYLPAALLVFIANVLNINPLISLYIARLALGLTSVGLIFLAIKLVPNRKYLFAAIALTPMILFQQAVVTIDGISYAFLLLFICYVLYLAKREAITTKQWTTLGLVCVAIMSAKPLVFLFLPFLLILSGRKYAKAWITSIALICVVVFAGINIYNSHKQEAVYDPNTPATVDSGRQLDNLKSHPKRFLRVLWNTYMTEYGDEEVRGVVGVFGAADTKYPLWMTLGFVLILGYFAGVVVSDEDKKIYVNKLTRLIILGLVAFYFILVNLLIYLSFSPFNFNIIYGVQGRYFLPILIMIPTLIAPYLIAKPTRRFRILGYAVAALAVFVVLALFITFQRYYLYTP